MPACMPPPHAPDAPGAGGGGVGLANCWLPWCVRLAPVEGGGYPAGCNGGASFVSAVRWVSSRGSSRQFAASERRPPVASRSCLSSTAANGLPAIAVYFPARLPDTLTTEARVCQASLQREGHGWRTIDGARRAAPVHSGRCNKEICSLSFQHPAHSGPEAQGEQEAKVV